MIEPRPHTTAWYKLQTNKLREKRIEVFTANIEFRISLSIGSGGNLNKLLGCYDTKYHRAILLDIANLMYQI